VPFVDGTAGYANLGNAAKVTRCYSERSEESLAHDGETLRPAEGDAASFALLRISCCGDLVIRKLKSRYLTFFALALLLVALVLILRPIDTRYQDLLRHGGVLAANNERTAAVAVYEEAAQLCPGDPEPYLRLVQLYLDWGRTDEALAMLAEAERLGVGEGDEARLERLWVAAYVARADWPSVVEHARRVIALSPGSDARHALARAYVEMREWDKARAEYETLLQSDPDDALAHERLGALLVGDDSAAIRHLFAAGTGLADELLGALDEPGVADDPAYTRALLGRVLFEVQEWALASYHFERALHVDPSYPDAHAYLGYALNQMGHSKEAWPHLLMAVSWAPDSVVTRAFLGLYYEGQGDYTAARTEYETAYDLDPTNPALCVAIGNTWAAEGRYVAAEIWLSEAVSLQPDNPVWWETLARFYLDHNITFEGRAISATEKLLEIAPDDAQTYDLSGWAAFQAGDQAAALDRLSQALDLDPTLASAHYHLGVLLDERGDTRGAQEAFVRAIDLDTTGEFVPLVERAMGKMP
jgi:tetratricopeptide (TPR) repeat protein